MIPKFKQWHLMCNRCRGEYHVLGWEYELPISCSNAQCRGFYEDMSNFAIEPAKLSGIVDKNIILEDLGELRFPEHLGG